MQLSTGSRKLKFHSAGRKTVVLAGRLLFFRRFFAVVYGGINLQQKMQPREHAQFTGRSCCYLRAAADADADADAASRCSIVTTGTADDQEEVEKVDAIDYLSSWSHLARRVCVRWRQVQIYMKKEREKNTRTEMWQKRWEAVKMPTVDV